MFHPPESQGTRRFQGHLDRPQACSPAFDRSPAAIAQAKRERLLSESGVQRKRPPEHPIVQRAVGFEFEFGEWTTTHNDLTRTPLKKGEEILPGAGFKIEGEDGQGGSAIEVVTKPYATLVEATASVGEAQKTFQDISTQGKEHKASVHTGGRDDVLITPHDTNGKMQASPAIPLDKIGALYNESTKHQFAGSVSRRLNDVAIGRDFLDNQAPSAELEGLALLILGYIEAGSGNGRLNYPKSAFLLMARTSFTKMFDLLPESQFFRDANNMDKWVNLFITLARQTFSHISQEDTGRFEQNPTWGCGLFGGGNKLNPMGHPIPIKRNRSMDEIMNAPMMSQPQAEMEPLPGDAPHSSYKLNITREDWLRNMSREDLLSKAKDKRFEGMGAYGNATDKEETNNQPREAPLFELRGLGDLFGIDQKVDLTNWLEKVEAVFKIVDNAVGGATFKPGGKPVVLPDVDSPGIWTKQ